MYNVNDNEGSTIDNCQRNNLDIKHLQSTYHHIDDNARVHGEDACWNDKGFKSLVRVWDD